MGVLANVLGIVGGGLLGLGCGRLISERFQKAIMMACAVAVIFLGLTGTVKEMLQIGADGGVTLVGTNCMLASLIGGAVIGEAIDLEDRMERFGHWLQQKTGSGGDTRFVEGFVTASLTVCIGAMAVIGSINDRLLSDPSVLFAKTVIDAVIVMIMTSALGKGCIFSAISVGIFQGIIFLLAGFLEPIMTPAALKSLSAVGNILIFCVGTNLFGLPHVRIANLLPALVIAVVWVLV
ncbi:membrane protein [Megasphaera elsdenii]|nr:membrane protein [Megasphaera elsdenii 14-14]KGI89059.1 membrane protein [Megasphaera elsdenii]